ncbi:hypothetical protein [Cellulomonas shaoxiangyii]|uniref:Uncharacterized protein n=1 Tax=Cellulomonas shaoxiangyii TaxID=2566013 RepID=A0A4P7SLW5_9CELL|nr:hypothetical protein [Cellulomonas shaoxiangyii]QCB94748.1 hypothetical protein E5225_15475 [Cellulomonas shaoxiangyii]TGY86478.1 hypothetical protein E5226_01500 [Cellulomonas shaoxiangyii]
MEAEAERVTYEYESRALLKLQQAGRVFQSLEREIDRWNEDHQLLAPMRSPHDGPSRLEVFRPQELDELPAAAWEATFHDGVHNLRVALDTLCFELCHIEGHPQEPGKIHFPVTAHPNEWPERTKHLSTIPAPLLERIRQVQGWARRDDGEPDPLTLIARADNDDKHRATGVLLDVLAMFQWAVRESHPLPPELANTRDWPLELWMDLRVTPPPERGQASLMPVLAWPFVVFQGLFANIADAQRWLYHETDRIISFLASGEWSNAGFERVLPGPVWSPWQPSVHGEGADVPADGCSDPR